MGQKNELLFAALAKAAEQRMKEFDEQEICNATLAFAKVDHKDEKLFEAFAALLETCVDKLTAMHWQQLQHQQLCGYVALATQPRWPEPWYQTAV